MMNLFENLQLMHESNEESNFYVSETLDTIIQQSDSQYKNRHKEEKEYGVKLNCSFGANPNYNLVTVSGDVDNVVDWLSFCYFDCGIDGYYDESDKIVQVWMKNIQMKIQMKYLVFNLIKNYILRL